MARLKNVKSQLLALIQTSKGAKRAIKWKLEHVKPYLVRYTKYDKLASHNQSLKIVAIN